MVLQAWYRNALGSESMGGGGGRRLDAYRHAPLTLHTDTALMAVVVNTWSSESESEKTIQRASNALSAHSPVAIYAITIKCSFFLELDIHVEVRVKSLHTSPIL